MSIRIANSTIDSPSGSILPAAPSGNVTASAAAPPKAASAPAKPPSQEQVQAAIREIQASIKNTASDLRFSVDKETGKTVVSIIDQASGETIRQVPNEEMLDIAKAVGRMQGLFINSKA
jgi:flagellar protein FlaG